MLFIKGEVRKISMEVTSCSDENFEISTAKVELFKDTKLIHELPKTLQKQSITVTLDTSNLTSGDYDLLVTYSIAEETMKRRFEVTIVNEC